MKRTAMILELNRLMTAEEVQRRYQIPDSIFEKVLPHLPVAANHDGINYYLESHIDRFLHRWFQSPGIRPGMLPSEDRMIPPDEVQVDGESYGPLTQQQWKLMEIVLEKQAVDLNKASRHVYGGRFVGKEEALRQHRKRINKLLLDNECRKSLEYVNNKFVFR